MSNFTPNEIILVDDRVKKYDPREKLVLQKISKTKQPKSISSIFSNSGTSSASIEDSKKKYHKKLSNKLLDDKLNGKCYWTILKRFINGKTIPCIPLYFMRTSFVTDFQVKSDIFNSPFAKQCSLLKNEIRIPL